MSKDEQQASRFPVLKDVANALDPTNPQLIDAIKATNVKSRPSIVRYAEVSKIVSAGVKDVLDGQVDDTSARAKLEEIEGDVQAVLDKGPP